MTNKSSRPGVLIARGALTAALAATLGLGLVGCGATSTDTSATSTSSTTTSAAADTLAAPTDFTMDWSTGKFTFTSNDDGIGYYFVRVYTNDGGVEGTEYVATSSRVSASKTGEMTGSIDLSSLSWRTYDFNLVSYAASGADKDAPAVQTYTYQLGVGGVMERPELMVLADGNTAEFYIDLYTLSDWYTYQRMPEVEFKVYSDAACTQSVATKTVDLSDLAPPAASGPWASGTNWATDAQGIHAYLQPSSDGGQQMGPMAAPTEPVALTSQLVIDDLDAGTYYVTATAKGSDDGSISDSKPSDAVEFTVTADAETGQFVATKSSLWQDPTNSAMGAGAEAGTYTDRVGFAAGQSTTAELVK